MKYLNVYCACLISCFMFWQFLRATPLDHDITLRKKASWNFIWNALRKVNTGGVCFSVSVCVCVTWVLGGPDAGGRAASKLVGVEDVLDAEGESPGGRGRLYWRRRCVFRRQRLLLRRRRRRDGRRRGRRVGVGVGVGVVLEGMPLREIDGRLGALVGRVVLVHVDILVLGVVGSRRRRRRRASAVKQPLHHEQGHHHSRAHITSTSLATQRNATLSKSETEWGPLGRQRVRERERE